MGTKELTSHILGLLNNRGMKNIGGLIARGEIETHTESHSVL